MSAPASLLRVVDAAPLIGLAKVGRLDVLTLGGRTALVPQAVALEVEAGPEGDPARQAVQGGWGTRTANVPVSADRAAFGLGAGEEATLALARHSGGQAVLDDGDGRRAARALNIPHTGTTALVVAARKAGFIPSAADLLRALRRAGLYLPSDAILQAQLQTVGEAWP